MLHSTVQACHSTVQYSAGAAQAQKNVCSTQCGKSMLASLNSRFSSRFVFPSRRKSVAMNLKLVNMKRKQCHQVGVRLRLLRFLKFKKKPETPKTRNPKNPKPQKKKKNPEPNITSPTKEMSQKSPRCYQARPNLFFQTKHTVTTSLSCTTP